MAAAADIERRDESTHTAATEADPQGVKGVLTGAVDQVQHRLKEVERSLNGAVEQLQHRLKEATDDVEKRFDHIKGSFKRFRGGEAEGDADGGPTLTEEMVAQLGLAKLADVERVEAMVDKLAKRVDTLKKKVGDATSKSEFKKLANRVAKLEKAAKDD